MSTAQHVNKVVLDRANSSLSVEPAYSVTVSMGSGKTYKTVTTDRTGRAQLSRDTAMYDADYFARVMAQRSGPRKTVRVDDLGDHVIYYIE